MMPASAAAVAARVTNQNAARPISPRGLRKSLNRRTPVPPPGAAGRLAANGLLYQAVVHALTLAPSPACGGGRGGGSPTLGASGFPSPTLPRKRGRGRAYASGEHACVLGSLH